MTEARNRSTRAALACLLAAAVLGSGVPAAPAPVAFALVLCAAGAVLRLWLPERLALVLRRVGDGLVVATAVLSFIWTLYPVVSEATLRRLATPLALALEGLALVALLASKSWPPGRTLVPATLALLALGSLLSAPGPRFVSCLTAAALAGAVWLVVDRESFDRRPVPPRLLQLLAFFLPAGALALAIARFLPWAQPMVESATASLVSPAASTGYAGFSLTSRLGDIEELALSSRVVLRAYTDTPQRLRGRVFARFDGRAWSAEPARGQIDLVARDASNLPPPLQGFFAELPGTLFEARKPDSQSTGAIVRTRFVSSVAEIEALLSPMAPLLVSLPRAGVRLDEQGILMASPPGQVEIYAVVNRWGGPGAGRPVEDVTLQVPAAIDPRVAALAESLGGTNGTPGERVERTLHHLDRCCRYSLKVPRPPGRDAVAGFLFETRKGYCEYFASAAALLLRLQGVPTRYVTGFNVRDESVVGDHYVVRESDAHAWIESYFPGQGWLEFDPTPSAQYAEVHSRPSGALSALLERVLALASEINARLHAGSLTASLSWLLRAAAPLALGLALALAAWLFRRRRTRAGRGERETDAIAIDPRVGELLVRVDGLFRKRGYPRPAARAPQEHLEALPQGALEPPLREDAARAVLSFYKARYAGLPPQASELDELLQRLPPA